MKLCERILYYYIWGKTLTLKSFIIAWVTLVFSEFKLIWCCRYSKLLKLLVLYLFTFKTQLNHSCEKFYRTRNKIASFGKLPGIFDTLYFDGARTKAK